MGDIEEAKCLLNKIINDVTNAAPKFSALIERIEATKSTLKKLEDEKQYLEDRISKEKKISNAYDSLLNLQEKGKNENFRRYNESVELFRSEALKNAKYALAANKKPLIYFLKGAGSSPLIHNFCYRSYIIKKKADITRKVHHLHQLQQRIFYLSEDFDNDCDDIFYKYQINQNADYSDYKMNNFSSSFKKELMEQPIPDYNFLVQDSISNISNLFPDSQNFSSNNEENTCVSFPVFHFKQSPSMIKKDIPNYFFDFNKMITLALQDITNSIEDLLKEMNDIFQIEESTIRNSTENFFKSNPSFIHTASVLCSNIIFKTQEKIHEAEQIAFLLNQNILPPETKVLNESHHIQSLLDELVSIFDTVYDRLSRNQIICQNISFDFDNPDLHDFSVDEISRAQINRCNTIVAEMKKIFEKNLTINNSFLGILNDILARTRENQSARPKFDMNFDTPPLPEIDNSEIKEKFIKLKQRILRKQSEQLDSFCQSLEEIPSEIKDLKIENEINLHDQSSQSPGLHFQANDQSSTTENSDDGNDVKDPLLEFKQNLEQMKSNPYQDSNKNLFERILQKTKDPPEIKTILPRKLNHLNSENNNENDISPTPSKHYQIIDDITENLSSSIYTDNIEELIKQRNILIEELHQKTEKFNFSQDQKNEKMKIKMSRRDLIKSKKIERNRLRIQFDEDQSKIQEFTNSLDEIQAEIDQLEDEKNELESQRLRIELLQSKYDKYEKLIDEINEEEKTFNEMQDEEQI